MRITFINVGYGEAILIQCQDKAQPNGEFTMLIDGGGNEEGEFKGFPFRVRAAQYLQNKGINHINLLVSTHIHEDHACGLLQVVRNMTVDNMWCNYRIPACFINRRVDLGIAENESQRKFISALNAYNELTEILLHRGTIIKEVTGISEGVEVCSGLQVDILGPMTNAADELKLRMKALYEAENDGERIKTAGKLDAWMNTTSVMLRLHAGTVKVLLPGDANIYGYRYIFDRPDLLEADIFKLGHHGQIDSVSQELVEKIKPKMIVSCASSDRRYNSANPKLFEIIEKCLDPHKPVFLFSDNVDLLPYSLGMKEHSALIIDINEARGKAVWIYE